MRRYAQSTDGGLEERSVAQRELPGHVRRRCRCGDDGRLDERVGDQESGRRPSLIAGFSAGGREALRIGLTGSPLEPVGLLLFGPGAPRWQIEPVRAVERGLRVWTFVGSDDWLLEKVQATNRTLRAAGLDVVEIVRGGDGHAMPDDLDDILPDALPFLLPSSGR